MKNIDAKKKTIETLQNNYHFDFKEDVFALSSSKKDILLMYAKVHKYRKPKNSYLSRSGAFYIHLQKLYYKISK